MLKIFCVIIVGAELVMAAFIQWAQSLLINFVLAGLCAFIVYFVGLGISWLLDRGGHVMATDHNDAEVVDTGPFLTAKERFIMLLSVACNGAILTVTQALESSIFYQITFYGMLIGAGLLLALWTKSAPHASILLGIVLCSSDAVIQTCLFLTDPDNHLFFESVIGYWAAADFLSTLNNILFEPAIVYAMWRIGSALNRRISDRQSLESPT